MGHDTRDCTTSPIGESPIAPTHPANYRQKAAHGGKTAQITGRADKAWAVALVDANLQVARLMRAAVGGTTARQAFWAFLAGSQKLTFLFPPSQTETPHA